LERLIHFFEVLLIPALALISFIISIADFFGLLDSVPWLSSSRIPVVTLLVGSLALGTLSILQSRQRTLQQHVEDILTGSVLEQTRRAIKRIHPDLLRIFEGRFMDHFTVFKKALETHSVEVQGRREYEYFYIRTLEGFPESTFLATTFIDEDYLWKNKKMKEAFARFIINEKGKIVRIFFLTDSQEITSPEVHTLLNEQYAMKVELYTVCWDLLSPDLQRLFVVESKGRIAWHASDVPLRNDPTVRLIATAYNGSKKLDRFIR